MSTVNGSTTAPPTTGNQLSAQAIESEALVFHVNLFIYAVLAFVVLLRIPQAIAVFGTSSDWYNGHFLRYVPYRRSRTRIVQAARTPYPPTPTKEYATDDSHTLYSHTTHVHQRLNEKGVPMDMRYPPHIASVPRILRALLGLLRVRIIPGYSAGHFIVLAGYFYTLLYAALFKSNVFMDPTRTGWIAVSQLPLIFALAQKNNVLGALLGYGYERLNFLHRFAGRLLLLAANLHSVHYFYQWSLAGTFSASIQRPSNTWGLVALICVDVLFFFSTAFWRERVYNLFLSTHIVGFIVVLPAIQLHQPTMLPYVLASLSIYLLDLLFRLVRTRLSTATIRPLPQLDLTRLEVPNVNAGWVAGQHVRLRIISGGMGLFGWTEIHPFTIASVSGSQEGLVLMCKKAGGWTNRLFDLATEGGYVEGDRKVKVLIEGPYGGPGRTIFSSFSGAVFIVGGSGISFALSAIQDLVQKDLKGQSRVKLIELIWVVQDAACLVPLVPLLSSLIQQSIFSPLRISVFYTRAVTGKLPFAPSSTDSQSRSMITIHPNLTLTPGRPRIPKTLDSAISRAVSLGAGVKDSERITGVVVGICGPAGLGDDVVKAVGTVDPARRDQVGGIEIHEETFGW